MVKRVNLLAFMWFFGYLCNVEKEKKGFLFAHCFARPLWVVSIR